MAEVLLEGRDLIKHYPVTKGLLKRTIGWVRAVDATVYEPQRGDNVSGADS